MEELIIKIQRIKEKIDEIQGDDVPDDLVETYVNLYDELYSLERNLEEIKHNKALENRDFDLSDGEIDLYLYGSISSNSGREYFIYLHDTTIKVGEIRFLGECKDTPPFCGNISYVVNKDFRGYNYALKALKLMTDQLFQEGIKTVYISAENANISSAKTIENFGGILRTDVETCNVRAYVCDLEIIKKKNHVPKI